MGLRKAPPGGRGGARREHFAYTPTNGGGIWTAYVAGPCQWFECHCKGRTKPCLDAVTGGELVCSKCNATGLPEPVGYLPLYREVDSRPVCVIVHEYTREVVDALRHHKRVKVMRGTQKSDGVSVREDPVQRPVFTTTLAHRMRPVDVTPSVLAMWATPELTAWYNANKSPSEEPVYYTPPQKPAPEPDPDPAPAAASDEPDHNREALLAILGRRVTGTEPSANGKYPPKG